MEFVREIEAAAAEMKPWLIKGPFLRDPSMFKTLLGLGARAQAHATATQRKTLPLSASGHKSTLRYPTPATPLQERIERTTLPPSSNPPPPVPAAVERVERVEWDLRGRAPAPRTPLQSRFQLSAAFAEPALAGDLSVRQSRFDLALRREAAQVAVDAERAQARRVGRRWISRGGLIVLLLFAVLFWGHQRTEQLFDALAVLTPKAEQHESAQHEVGAKEPPDELVTAEAKADAKTTTQHPSPAPSSRSTRASSLNATHALTAKVLSEQAADAMNSGDYSSAASKYQQAIALDVRYAPAWQGKGLALEHLGESRNAAGAFRRFLELAPHDPNAPLIRARLQSLESAR
jgi:hypothetical protein